MKLVVKGEVSITCVCECVFGFSKKKNLMLYAEISQDCNSYLTFFTILRLNKTIIFGPYGCRITGVVRSSQSDLYEIWFSLRAFSNKLHFQTLQIDFEQFFAIKTFEPIIVWSVINEYFLICFSRRNSVFVVEFRRQLDHDTRVRLRIVVLKN